MFFVCVFSSIIYSEKRIGIKYFDKSSQILPTNSFIRARMALWALSLSLSASSFNCWGAYSSAHTHTDRHRAVFICLTSSGFPTFSLSPRHCRHVFLRQDDSRERAQTKTDIILKNRRIAAFYSTRRRSIFYCGLARNSFVFIFANTKGRIVVYIFFLWRRYICPNIYLFLISGWEGVLPHKYKIHKLLFSPF